MAIPAQLGCVPRVAVLLSTYNGGRFLDEQLASLRAQQDVEVILHVRDDGSTDATREILARYADLWPALSDVRCGPNLGPAASFLELLRTAPEADYYAFCDQDDVWLPGKLARAVSGLHEKTGPALYCSNVTCVDENMKVLGAPRENGDASFRHLLFENIAYGCTTVLNRAARAVVVGRMPERGVIMHDWWCALVVAAVGEVSFDPKSHIYYRQHGSNSVGADVNLIAQTVVQARELIRRPKSYYRVHAQAAEFLRLYGLMLRGDYLKTVERMVSAKLSFSARLRLALSREIVRSRFVGSVAARALVLAGWY